MSGCDYEAGCCDACGLHEHGPDTAHYDIATSHRWFGTNRTNVHPDCKCDTCRRRREANRD